MIPFVEALTLTNACVTEYRTLGVHIDSTQDVTKLSIGISFNCAFRLEPNGCCLLKKSKNVTSSCLVCACQVKSRYLLAARSTSRADSAASCAKLVTPCLDICLQ